jgi:hypothetical protein
LLASSPEAHWKMAWCVTCSMKGTLKSGAYTLHFNVALGLKGPRGNTRSNQTDKQTNRQTDKRE